MKFLFLIPLLRLFGQGGLYTDYAPLNRSERGVLEWRTEGYSGALSAWETYPAGRGRGEVIWCDPASCPYTGAARDLISAEDFRVKFNCGPLEAAVWLEGYHDWVSGNYYRVLTTRAVYTDLSNGRVVDISNAGNCKTGQPYAMYGVTSTPYRLQVWGTVLGSDGQPFERFFWDTEMSVVREFNPCRGEARAALMQKQAWWDSRSGWGGFFDGAAFADELLKAGGEMERGEPSGRGVVWPQWLTIAKGAGWAWTYGGFDLDGKRRLRACLR